MENCYTNHGITITITIIIIIIIIIGKRAPFEP
jgi:hypothetical protein